MPDRRRHRGPHPEDARLFTAEQLPALREAVSDLSWLLGRGYADKSALKLVGDRFGLRQRQRLAVMRSACSDAARTDRRERQLSAEQMRGQPLQIDGYNVLTTIEAALAGGVLLLGRDGCLRDLASMHGSYRKVHETRHAIDVIGRGMDDLGIRHAIWYLDAPVSNSGRLKQVVAEIAEAAGWDWQVAVVPSPDHVLIETDQPIATADSVVLDDGGRWFNLARQIVQGRVDQPWLVDLRDSAGPD